MHRARPELTQISPMQMATRSAYRVHAAPHAVAVRPCQLSALRVHAAAMLVPQAVQAAQRGRSRIEVGSGTAGLAARAPFASSVLRHSFHARKAPFQGKPEWLCRPAAPSAHRDQHVRLAALWLHHARRAASLRATRIARAVCVSKATTSSVRSSPPASIVRMDHSVRWALGSSSMHRARLGHTRTPRTVTVTRSALLVHAAPRVAVVHLHPWSFLQVHTAAPLGSSAARDARRALSRTEAGNRAARLAAWTPSAPRVLMQSFHARAAPSQT
jgi:hypothetical protein